MLPFGRVNWSKSKTPEIGVNIESHVCGLCEKMQLRRMQTSGGGSRMSGAFGYGCINLPVGEDGWEM